jgi:hypothetical protein
MLEGLDGDDVVATKVHYLEFGVARLNHHLANILNTIPVYFKASIRSQRNAKLIGLVSFSKTASRCSLEYFLDAAWDICIT